MWERRSTQPSDVIMEGDGYIEGNQDSSQLQVWHKHSLRFMFWIYTVPHLNPNPNPNPNHHVSLTDGHPLYIIIITLRTPTLLLHSLTIAYDQCYDVSLCQGE